MTITLPDDPALTEMREAEILLDLACVAYAAGNVSGGVPARMAGLDSHASTRPSAHDTSLMMKNAGGRIWNHFAPCSA